MKTENYKKNALILIDIQKGFLDTNYWGKRNNADFEKNARRLLEICRQRSLSVIHVQHLSVEEKSPLRPGQSGAEFMEGFQPENGERIFQKSVNSAFIGTHLEEYLRAAGIHSITLAGLTSDHCVSTTARMGANLGFAVTIVSDCTATFDRTGASRTFPAELVHDVSLASLNGEFATVLTAEEFEKTL